MKTMDAASIKRLNEIIACLRQTSKGCLMANLYQKIVFLIELNHFRTHQNLFVGLVFNSLKYGPFSVELAKALDAPDEKMDISLEVQSAVEEVLEEFGLQEFSYETMQKAYAKMNAYISSLYIYNITPFEFALDFEKYNFEDLFETVAYSNLNGEQLEREMIQEPLTRQRAKEYEHFFA